jgi:hypothetical protein
MCGYAPQLDLLVCHLGMDIICKPTYMKVPWTPERIICARHQPYFKLSARESMELSYTSVYILYPFPGDTLVIEGNNTSLKPFCSRVMSIYMSTTLTT